MTQSYSTDTVFPSYFVADQAPVSLSWATNLAGRRHVFRPSFTYADFGCGDGLTLVLLAAANPQAGFIGIDVNADHIAKGRSLADRAGLTNIAFVEQDFTTLTDAQLPELDYATSAGIFSWLEPDQREHLIEKMTGRLKPDGLAFVKYSVFPSGAMMTVLGTLTRILGRHKQDAGGVAATQTGLKTLTDLLQTDDLEFNAFFPKATGILTEQAKLHPQYLSHDIGNTHPNGVWFHQVADGFAAHGATFVGQAKPELNVFADLAHDTVGEAYQSFCETHDDLVQRQEVLGLLSNRNVRADIFGFDDACSGTAEFSGFTLYNARGARYAELLKEASKGVRADLTQPIYQAIMQSLTAGPCTGDELEAKLASSYALSDLHRALSHLAGAQMVACGVAGMAKQSQFAPTPLDEYLTLELMNMPAPLAYPSRQMGSCLYISQQDRILLGAVLLGSLSKLWEVLEVKGVRLQLAPTQQIDNQAVFEKIFAPLVERFKAQRISQLIMRGMLTDG